jgi:hypothetical protein
MVIQNSDHSIARMPAGLSFVNLAESPLDSRNTDPMISEQSEQLCRSSHLGRLGQRVCFLKMS